MADLCCITQCQWIRTPHIPCPSSCASLFSCLFVLLPGLSASDRMVTPVRYGTHDSLERHAVQGTAWQGMHQVHLCGCSKLVVEPGNLIAHEEYVLANVLTDGGGQLVGERLAELHIAIYSMHFRGLAALFGRGLAIQVCHQAIEYGSCAPSYHFCASSILLPVHLT